MADMTDKMDTGDQRSRREYVRASDNIPVYYETYADGAPVVTTDWEALFDDIEPSPEENPRLYELLFAINQKLNLLIGHFSRNVGFNLPEARDVNISGGGLKFVCDDSFESGAKLLLKMFLPTYAHVVKLRCEVVRSVKGESGYEVAAKYVDLDEGTRDKIIRYIFSRQRKLLRTDKTEGDAGG